jgi:glycosyltransferase involved in cell wall biosynthesis
VSLDYPKGLLEIVVVDDNSDDDTPEVVRRFAERHGFIKYLRRDGPGRYRCPKKSALAAGIDESVGEIIFVTDADCRPGPGWIKGMLGCFEPEVKLVCGYSPLVSGPGLLNGLLSLWSFVTPLLGSASTGWGNVLTAAGRNMAYRRRTFDDVGGFDEIGDIVSGDDVLLARLIQRKFPGTTRFAFDPAACVPSLLRVDSIKAILQQGIRHNSRSPHLSRKIQASGLGAVVFYLTVLSGLFLAPAVGAGAFVLKVALDRVVLGRAAAMLGSKHLLRYQFPAEVIHLAAFPLFTILGTLTGFVWRDRRSVGAGEPS